MEARTQRRNLQARNLACAAGLVATLAAQPQYVTVPAGLDNREGNSVSTFVHPFAHGQARFQYTDGAMRNQPHPNITKLELRRDGTAVGTYPSRTANLALLMAETDAGQLTTNFAANYRTAPTTVFLRKPINIPDLSNPPSVPPAQWAIAIPFDVNWNYSGTADLLWEIQLDSNSNLGAPLALDAVEIVVSGLGSYVYNGLFSCITAGGTFDIYGIEPLTSQAGIVSFANYALRGPVSAPGVFAIGIGDPNLSGVFCAPLRTTADILIPVQTDATGAIGSQSAPIGVTFPFPGPLTLFTQFAAIDSSQLSVPIALSDGVRSQVVEWVPNYQVSRLSSTLSANAPSGIRSAYQVLVARLTY